MFYNIANRKQEVNSLNAMEEIEQLRQLLNKAVEKGTDSNEIIKISQMLDKLIVDYMESEA